MLLLLSSALAYTTHLLLYYVEALTAFDHKDAQCVECLSKPMDAGACLLTHALLSFKRWGDETPQAGRFFAIFAALLVELTIDNAFTWYMHSSAILHACHVC